MIGLRRMFVLLLFCIPLASACAQIDRLSTFDALLAALREGRQVRVTIEYAKCRLLIDSVAQPSPDAIGGMAVATFEYFARGVVRNPRAYVVTSETHLIGHPRYGYVHNYVRIRTYEDNSVEIVARYLAPTSYDVVMDETFLGNISDGADNEGVHFTAVR